jgi:1-phosphofructokinase
MITAVCANPCVDRSVYIDSFTFGGMNRITHTREDGCGKGVNVALVCRAFGLKAACIGIMPHERNALILDRLARGGCETEFIPCGGAVRVNTKVIDAATGVTTELNERGPEASAAEFGQLLETAVYWAGKSSHIVFSGSVPPGSSAGIYKTMIDKVKAAAPKCSCVLDAEGALFAEGLKASPQIVKPNRYELELLCGRKLSRVADVHTEAQKIISLGVRIAAVSLGADGAYITDGNEAFFAPAVDVKVVNTMGAGDSMVAGLLLGLTQGLPLEETFRRGVAAAASSLSAEGTGLVDTELYQECLKKVDVRRVQ